MVTRAARETSRFPSWAARPGFSHIARYPVCYPVRPLVLHRVSPAHPIQLLPLLGAALEQKTKLARGEDSSANCVFTERKKDNHGAKIRREGVFGVDPECVAHHKRWPSGTLPRRPEHDPEQGQAPKGGSFLSAQRCGYVALCSSQCTLWQRCWHIFITLLE